MFRLLLNVDRVALGDNVTVEVHYLVNDLAVTLGEVQILYLVPTSLYLSLDGLAFLQHSDVLVHSGYEVLLSG